MPTRIKFCGITRAEDAQKAVALGVHAIGLVFHPTSPRRVSLEQACAIRHTLPPFVSVVALFLDAAAEEVRRVVQALRPDILQFHGSEPADYCASFPLPFIKTLGMTDSDVAVRAARYPQARALLLDSHAQGGAGGTGKSFDWSRVPAGLVQPVILAGGLRPDNVAQAVRQVRPYAVDVSSGIESAPGRKDAQLMEQFVLGVKHGDGDE